MAIEQTNGGIQYTGRSWLAAAGPERSNLPARPGRERSPRDLTNRAGKPSLAGP